MSAWLVFVFVVVTFALLLGCWLGWQLLRQNGRVLLRLDELEERLNELEFGEGEQPAGLTIGSEAPDFALPHLAGERKSLAQFRGQPVLLIFFNPDCGFCRELMPRLAALETERGRSPCAAATNAEVRLEHLDGAVSPDSLRSGTDRAPQVLILTTGGAGKNCQFFEEHKVVCPVLLQSDGEVAKAYQANGTPSGYLISPEGKTASELALGADALLALAEGKSKIRYPISELDPAVSAEGGGEINGRASRFGNRSLAHSKIKRDGLKGGTPAPGFRLPRLDGKGDLSLSDLRGQRVLLVFSSPGCGPCNTLAPELEKSHRQQSDRDRSPVAAGGHARTLRALDQRDEVPSAADGDRPRSGPVTVVMVSNGEPKENRAKVKEHGLTFAIVLQRQWEISRRYAMFATPIAYLIDEQGVIARDVAVGSESILELIGRTEILHPAAKNGHGSVRKQPLVAAAGVL